MRSLLESYILPRLSKNQFGFIRGRSTEDALLYADHMIRNQMSKSKRKKGTVAAVSFDIKKAFDTVPFGKLIDCLRSEYSIPECLLTWLSSYFRDREQAVRVDGNLSTWREVKAGVIQGSVIGPLLFIAYFDKVSSAMDEESVAIKYADDLVLLHPINEPTDEINLQRSIDSLTNAMDAKSLTVNSDKCHYTTISESTVPYLLTSAPTVGANPVDHSDKLEYLGVTVDMKLTWCANTRLKISKAKQAAGSIRRLLKNKMPRPLLRQLLTSKIVPVFMYGMTAAYPRNKTDQIALERLNRFLLRLSTNDYTSPYTDLLERTSTIPIYQRVLHNRINLAQRYSKGLRYLPPRTIQPYNHNNITRRRFHNFAIVPTEPTGLRYRDSALELTTQAWNRVPTQLILGNSVNVKNRLEDTGYADLAWDVYTEMQMAVLVL